MNTSRVIYSIVSISTLPLLLLLLPPHLLPPKYTIITHPQRISPISVSLILCAAVRIGLAILDLFAYRTDGKGVLCEIDACLNTLFTTALIAHLPVLAFHTFFTTDRDRSPIATKRTIAIILPIYVYAIIPLIPTFATLHPSPTITPDSNADLSQWWGLYCAQPAPWWRIVRPTTLALPLVLTLIISFLNFETLFTLHGHPSNAHQIDWRIWAKVSYISICAGCVLGYLLVEQILGWEADWWPRAFEAASGPLVFLPYALNIPLWKTYIQWLHLSDSSSGPQPQVLPFSHPYTQTPAPSIKSALTPSNPLTPPTATANSVMRSIKSGTSSFYSPAASFRLRPPVSPVSAIRLGSTTREDLSIIVEDNQPVSSLSNTQRSIMGRTTQPTPYGVQRTCQIPTPLQSDSSLRTQAHSPSSIYSISSHHTTQSQYSDQSQSHYSQITSPPSNHTLPQAQNAVIRLSRPVSQPTLLYNISEVGSPVSISSVSDSYYTNEVEK